MQTIALHRYHYPNLQRMKAIMFFSFSLLACLFPSTAKSQLHTIPAPLEAIDELTGIYWFPMSEKGVAYPRKGFMFTDKHSLRGHDGCNAFWGDYSYIPEKGFQVKRLIHTELKCIEGADLFSVGFLSQAYSFELQGCEIVFFDKKKQEIIRLFSFVNVQEKSEILPTGDWKVVESNAPDFQAIKEASREPYLRLTKDGRFVVNYNKDKKNWTGVNYFAGYCNMNKQNKNIFFYVNAEASSLAMPNGEDAQVAHHFKMAQHWEMKGKQLIIRSGEHYFVLESI
jgi:hypothetical protein